MKINAEYHTAKIQQQGGGCAPYLRSRHWRY